MITALNKCGLNILPSKHAVEVYNIDNMTESLKGNNFETGMEMLKVIFYYTARLPCEAKRKLCKLKLIKILILLPAFKNSTTYEHSYEECLNFCINTWGNFIFTEYLAIF